MRSCLLSMVVLVVGCAAEEAAPLPNAPAEVVSITAPVRLGDSAGDDDLCALADELPFDDICSLVCDPAAMAARMLDDGNEPGACYQLYCALPGDAHVLVGVCLPP